MTEFFSTFESSLFSLLMQLFRSKNNASRLSAINKYRDYKQAMNDAPLLELHESFFKHLSEERESWCSYDYGEGYFYQGLKSLGITGLRNSDARIAKMNLKDRVKEKNVLEIGCNTGFLALGLADSAQHIVGLDINPHLNGIAQEAARYLDASNTAFIVEAFENYAHDQTFDCVISFANHSTFDGNTKQSLSEYFQKCSAHLKNGGSFLFESHPPFMEKDTFENTAELIEEHFSISERSVLTYGTYLDTGRTFIVGTKRS